MNDFEDDEKVMMMLRTSHKYYWFSKIFAVIILIGSLGMFFPISLGIALYIYLTIRSNEFKVTSERLIIKEGLIARNMEEIELFRIKDVSVKQGGYKSYV